MQPCRRRLWLPFLVVLASTNLRSAPASRVLYETYLPIPTTAQNIYQPAAPVVVTVDPAGHPYVAGTRAPSAGVSQAFITKYTTDGKTELFTTQIGDATALAVAVDPFGNIYLAGTTSAGFKPTPGTFQQTGGSGFLAKFNASGALVWASRLSATPSAIAIDAKGVAYVSGYALEDFVATPGAFRSDTGPPTCGSPHVQNQTCSDAFVVKVSADGARLFYATLLGGSKTETAAGIAVAPTGAVYIAGTTSSRDFPITPGALETQLDRGREPSTDPFEYRSDAFLSKLNPTGTGVEFSTYIGGTQWDMGGGMAMAPDGSIYLTGSTGSSDFTVTPGAYQTTYRYPERANTVGYGSGFFLKLTPGRKLTYSSFYSTSQYESAGAAALDPSTGRLYFIHNANAGNACAPYVTLVAVNAESGEMLGEQDFQGAYMNTASLAAGPQGLLYATARADVSGNPFAVTEDAPFRTGTALLVAMDFSKSNDFLPSCLVNGASFRVSRQVGEEGISLAPGEIISLFGHGLGAGVSLSVNDAPLTVLYASETQINAVVPYGTPLGPSTLTIQRESFSAAYPAQVVEVFPGIFSTVRPGELSHAVIINEDGTLNAEDHPAPVGSVIRFYATGLGALTGAGELAVPFQLLTEGSGTQDLPMEILSARPAEGFPPGVIEVKARVPPSTSTLSPWISIRYPDPWSRVSTSSGLWVTR